MLAPLRGLRGAGRASSPSVCVRSRVCARWCVCTCGISQGPSVHGCVRAYLPLFLKIPQSVHLARFKL